MNIPEIPASSISGPGHSIDFHADTVRIPNAEISAARLYVKDGHLRLHLSWLDRWWLVLLVHGGLATTQSPNWWVTQLIWLGIFGCLWGIWLWETRKEKKA